MSTSILLAGIFLVIVLLVLAARLLNCRHFFLVCHVCVCAKWHCGPQAFLANTVATGYITKAMHRIESCERCRAFPEQVGPRILSLESVDYSGTNDYYFSGRKTEQSY